MKNSSASSEVLTGDHQTGSQHKRGHEPLFDAYIFYVTVGTYITALSKLFLTLSRCVGSNLVSKLQGPREARIVKINFKHERRQAGESLVLSRPLSPQASSKTNSLKGWPSIGEKGPRGRAPSFPSHVHARTSTRMRTHIHTHLRACTHVRARTHTHTHTHAHTNTQCMHACMHTTTHTHARTQRTLTHTHIHTHTHTHTCTHMHTHTHTHTQTHTYAHAHIRTRAHTRACRCSS